MSSLMSSDENDLTLISSKVEELTGQLSENFKKMVDLFNSMPSCFEGGVPDEIVNKFNLFQDYFSIIIDNFKSINDDVILIRDNHINKDKSSTTSDIEVSSKGGVEINVNRY